VLGVLDQQDQLVSVVPQAYLDSLEQLEVAALLDLQELVVHPDQLDRLDNLDRQGLMVPKDLPGVRGLPVERVYQAQVGHKVQLGHQVYLVLLDLPDHWDPLDLQARLGCQDPQDQ